MTCIEFTVIPVALCWHVLSCSCQCVCACFVCQLNMEPIIDWKMLGELTVPPTPISTVASLCSWIRCFIVTHFCTIVVTFYDWFWWNGGWDHQTCKSASPPFCYHAHHSLLSQQLSLRKVFAFLLYGVCVSSHFIILCFEKLYFIKKKCIFLRLVCIYAADTLEVLGTK